MVSTRPFISVWIIIIIIIIIIDRGELFSFYNFFLFFSASTRINLATSINI